MAEVGEGCYSVEMNQRKGSRTAEGGAIPEPLRGIIDAPLIFVYHLGGCLVRPFLGLTPRRDQSGDLTNSFPLPSQETLTCANY